MIKSVTFVSVIQCLAAGVDYKKYKKNKHEKCLPLDIFYSNSYHLFCIFQSNSNMKRICFSVVLAVACATLASASIIGHPAAIEIEEHSPPHYEFQYAVHDTHTGDIKDQFEHRRGEYVTGRYSLVEPDGHRRVVDYSSDPLLGFSAQVRRESPTLVTGHAVVAPVVEEWPAPSHRR